MCSFLLCTFLNIADEYMNILLLSPCSVWEISFLDYEYSLFECIFWLRMAAAQFCRRKVLLLHIRILLNIIDCPAVPPGRERPCPAPFDAVLIDEWGTSVIN